MAIDGTTLRIRRRVLFGQLLEAASDDALPSIRVKLGDGSESTMAADDAVRHKTFDLVGQQVELGVCETVADGAVVDRIVDAVRPLDPGECGIETPPKSIDELAREQGVDRRPRADYFEILSGLWETEEEADAFRREIRAGRGKAR